MVKNKILNIFKTNKQYKNVSIFLKDLTLEQRHALNSYLVSGAGELPQGADVDTLTTFLLNSTIPDLEELVTVSSAWATQNDLFIQAENTVVDPDSAENNISARQINLTLNVNENIDPTRVLILSRDITDSDRLTLQEINVDTGDYVPVPVGAVAGILREYADAIERNQEEINSQELF